MFAGIRLRGGCSLTRGCQAGSEHVIEGTLDAEGAAVEDVGVDLGGADVGMAEQLLDGADVVAALEEVGGEAVAEAVAAWLACAGRQRGLRS